MALTVVKYRKSGAGNAPPTALIQRPKPVIKIGDGSGIVIKRAGVNPAQKRSSSSSHESGPAFKSPKFSLQTIASAGTPLTSLQWQPSSSRTSVKKPLSNVIGSLPPSTIIQTSSNANKNTSGTSSSSNRGVTISPMTGPVGTMQVRRPTIYIKREAPERTIRQITIDLIEKNPRLYIGLDSKRLQLLKNIISTSTGVPIVDCYLTMRKLRQNEDCALLAELFEMTEEDVQKIVARSVASLAQCMRGLIRWPESKKYYDRYKDMPFEFRDSLAHVQSLIEIVDTEMRFQPDNLECQSYRYILSITPTGVITYVSDAFLGKYDDLAIFAAAKFKDIIPKYLTLMVEPGKAIKRQNTKANSDYHLDSTEDSMDEMENGQGKAQISNYAAQRLAGQLAADRSLSVINNELCSSKVKNLKIPTLRAVEPVCRETLHATIDRIREFRILEDFALREPIMFQYLNEIIIVVAAFTNLMLE